MFASEVPNSAARALLVMPKYRFSTSVSTMASIRSWLFNLSMVQYPSLEPDADPGKQVPAELLPGFLQVYCPAE
jgi:hypothetical protein